MPHQTFLSFLCIRESEIKQKCQWKIYIKGFLYTSLECLQFCIVRSFHTQTSRIAHNPHTHNVKRALTLSTVPSIHVCISETFQFELHLHKMCMVMYAEVKYPHLGGYFKILSVSVSFFLFIKGDMNIFPCVIQRYRHRCVRLCVCVI